MYVRKTKPFENTFSIWYIYYEQFPAHPIACLCFFTFVVAQVKKLDVFQRAFRNFLNKVYT